MLSTQTILSTAHGYLSVFEESWKSVYDAAGACRSLDELVTEAILVFELVDAMARLRRKRVFHGMDETDAKADEDEKILYIRWLAIVEEATRGLETCETRLLPIKRGEELRECQEKARAILANWVPQALSMGVGCRVIEFSEEDVEELYALLQSPPGSPGRPTREFRSVPPGDPSALR